ncbi:hypothetical protein STA1M1_13350 [Sinisalibacter aestuarii]|uniref:Uncharacterized protein n=1 Tax=Sinisalibacter aestuarii TaxID=2949426 RepID=A0ABQ5LR39_9RHOB|nr:hypothetical protein STA1M1_13350 [Sinisalibacter aestuarii]
MLLRGIAVWALIAAAASIYLASQSDEPMNFTPAAIQGIVAFAVLMALARIVDALETIAENTKR